MTHAPRQTPIVTSLALAEKPSGPLPLRPKLAASDRQLGDVSWAMSAKRAARKPTSGAFIGPRGTNSNHRLGLCHCLLRVDTAKSEEGAVPGLCIVVAIRIVDLVARIRDDIANLDPV